LGFVAGRILKRLKRCEGLRKPVRHGLKSRPDPAQAFHGLPLGHSGLAVRTASGWLLRVGAAAFLGLGGYKPEMLVRFAQGPHAPRVRECCAAGPKCA
jgi:hypothetical protein